MSKLKIFFILFSIFIFAFFLRVIFLKDNALTFGYDQARDAIISQQILKSDIKIQGPPSSTPGLYHGVLYYYFLAPAYLFGHGSPIVAAYYLSFFNSLTVFIVFLITYYLSRKSVVKSLLASFLFAISFEATQYATWLSNPTMAVWTVPITYLGLWLWVSSETSEKLKKVAVVVAGLGLGFSIQSEIFLGYHLIPIIIWLSIAKKNITKKQIIIFVFTFLLSLSTMIISEFKFGFKGIFGLKDILTLQEHNLAYAKSLGDYSILYLNQIGRVFAFNSYPENISYGGGLILGLALFSLFKGRKEYKFLATWLFSHLSVVMMGGFSTPFLMVGIGPAVSIILALYLIDWWENHYKIISVFLFVVLVIGNISMIYRENSKGSTLFSIQNEMTLKNQFSVIDYTYLNANKEKFTINTVTSPLWINIVWTYLYKWYGNEKYGYVPEWHGKDQIGQLNSLPRTSVNTKKSFLIIEPMGGIPVRFRDEAISEEDAYSTFVKENNWGEFRVQTRNIYIKK